MTKKSIETSKPNLKPDDLLKPTSEAGKIEMTELTDEELGKVSGGIISRADMKWTTTTSKKVE
jgi:hypothetical protein